MSEPQYADPDELWTALEPHIDWPRGLALTLLFADHPQTVNAMRERAEELAQSGGRTLFVLVPWTVEELSSVVAHLLVRPADQVRALWIELWRGSGGAGWDHGVGDVLQLLNERRAALERVLRRPLVLVLPTSLRAQIHALAPDLWTIRTFTADLPSPPAVPSTPSAPVAPKRSGSESSSPSLEEREWARLLATSEHARIDAWDGLRASAAAMKRGSLASARSIASQVIALLVHGQVGEDASVMTTDDILRSLPEVGSSNVQQELLWAVIELGDVEVDEGNLSAARALFQRSLEISETLASADPHRTRAQRDLSVSLDKLGDVEGQAGNLSAARALFQRSLEISETLASADPHSARAQRDLSVSLNKLGNVEVQSGNLSAARALFQRSLAVRETLASEDPLSAQAQRDLSVSWQRLGDVEVEAGNLSAARARFQRSLAISETLASADPLSAQAQRDLSVSLNKLGGVEATVGALDLAKVLFLRSLHVHEHLAKSDSKNTFVQLELIEAHLCLCELGERLGDLTLQREHFEAASALLALSDVAAIAHQYTYAGDLARRIERARAGLESANPH